MDEPDAEPVGIGHAGDPHRLARHADCAFVRLVDSAKDIDERGFSGTVLAEQRVDFPRAQLEVHPVQRDDSAEALADAAQL